jgi:aminodeoxyfutalosine synthase
MAVESFISETHALSDIAHKVYNGERLTREDALRLYESDDLMTVGALAEYARRRKAGPGKEKYVYYIHNMHLNPTNFCVETCRFCSYANPSERSKAYTWTVDKVLEEAGRGSNLGICEIHMVGGLNPACNLAYYQDILTEMRRQYPHIHMKAFTAVEIEYLANLEGMTYEEVLKAPYRSWSWLYARWWR